LPTPLPTLPLALRKRLGSIVRRGPVEVNNGNKQHFICLHHQLLALLTLQGGCVKLAKLVTAVSPMANDREAFYEEVGSRIRKARRARKPPLTQEALGKLVSLNRTSITNIEKGRQNFLLHTLADIAAALNVTCYSLLPDSELEADEKLDAALKGMPKSEKDWIKSALSASERRKTPR